MTAALTAACGSLAWPSTAAAVTYTWTGNGFNANWDLKDFVVYTNWDSLTLPPSNADVYFGTGFVSGNPNLNGNRTIGSIYINTANSFSIVGNPGNTLTLSLGSVQRADTASGSQTIAVPLNVGFDAIWNIAGSGLLTIGGPLGGSGVSIEKVGNGTLQFGTGSADTGANTFNGPITMSGGTLLLNKAANTNAIAGGLTIGSGGVILKNSNQIADTADLAVNSGIVQMNGFSETVGSLSGNALNGGLIDIGGAGTLTVNQSSNTTYSGVINGAGGNFVKGGSGTLTLGLGSSDIFGSSYDGLTIVNGGALVLNKAPDTHAVSKKLLINAGGSVFQAASDQMFSDATVTLNGGRWNLGPSCSQTVGSLSGTGGSITFGAGANLTVEQAGSTLFAGSLNSPGSWTFTKNAGGTLTMGGGASDTTADVGGSSTVVNGGALVLNKADGTDAIGNTLTINDSGIVRLARSNQITNDQTHPVTVNAGGLLDLAGFNESVEAVTGAGAVNLVSGNLTILAQHFTGWEFDGAISGAGGLTKNGPNQFTLGSGAADTLASTFTGTTIVNAGTLALNKADGTNAIGGTLSVSSGGVARLQRSNQIPDSAFVTMTTGGTLMMRGVNETIGGLSGNGGTLDLGIGGALTVNQASNTTFGGAIVGSNGSLTKTGPGSLTIGSGPSDTVSNTTAGAFTVSGGALVLNKADGANAVSGNLQIDGGRVVSNRSNQIVDGANITISSGTLNFDVAGSEAIGGLSGTGGVVNLPTGTLSLNPIGDTTFAGSIRGVGNLIYNTSSASTFTIGGGAADTAANTNTGTTIVNGGALNLNKANGTNAIGGNLTINSNTTVSLAQGNQIADNGLVTISSFGLLSLPGLSETVGGLAGTGGTIDFSQGTFTVNQSTNRSFAGSLSGTNGAFIKSGSGSLGISGGGGVRSILVNGGVLNLNGGTYQQVNTLIFPTTAIGVDGNASVIISNGAHVTSSGLPQVATIGSGTLGGTLTVSGAGTQWNAPAVNVGQAGTGTLIVDAGAYGATSTTVGAGTAGIAIVRNGGSMTDSFGLYVAAAAGQPGTLTLNGSQSKLTSPLLSMGAGSDGTPGGHASLNVASLGVATISGTTTFFTGTSAITIDGGSLTTGGLTDHNGVGGSVRIGNPAGGVALTVGTDNSSSAFSGTIADSFFAGAGGIRKVGNGTFTLTGSNNSYSGGTTVDGGTFSIANALALGTGTLNVNSASVVLQPTLVAAPRVNALSITGTGKLDVNNNGFVIANATSKSQVEAYVHSARDGGVWDGAGITSSAARTQANHATTLGVLSGAEYNSVGGNGNFPGQAYFPTDSLVRYTYYGDTDFNGKVNFDDYVRTDNGFNNHLSGWLNGDFDLNGQVNFDDYVLIDLAFNNQSGTLTRALRFLDGSQPQADDMSDPALRMVQRHFEEFGADYAGHFVAAVPEPTVLGTLLPLALVRRRRRVCRA